MSAMQRRVSGINSGTKRVSRCQRTQRYLPNGRIILINIRYGDDIVKSNRKKMQ